VRAVYSRHRACCVFTPACVLRFLSPCVRVAAMHAGFTPRCALRLAALP